jgi:hypothetical protein
MKRSLVFSLLFIFSLFPAISRADVAPSVSTLTVDQSTRNSGQFTNLSWSLLNAGGSSLILPCVSGIKYADQTGATLACSTRISLTSTTNDGYPLIIHNISGLTKTVTLQVVPKDPISLVDYDAGGKTVGVSVSPLSEPITSFSTDTTGNNVTSGKPFNFTWTTSILDGVNLYLECRGGVLATSSSYTNSIYLPCGAPIFTTDLGTSGSVNVTIFSNDTSTTTLEARLLPAISPLSYDGTHAKSISLSIGPTPVVVSQINSFSASSTNIYSGDNLTFSWSTKNVQGVNLKLSCNSAVIAAIATSTALPCDTYIGSTDFGVSDKVTITFKTTTETVQPITVTLVPSIQSGQYDATKAKNIFIIIHPRSEKNNPTSAIITTSTKSSGSFKKASVVFTTLIYRGSSGKSVTALQQFLAQDSTIYPEGLVTGFFGPATERAIGRFQQKYGIAGAGQPGYGMLGPKTRAYINGIK